MSLVASSPPPAHCDLVVVGTGAAGMTAALSAKAAGLDVILIEKRERLGGTTALSGGVIWVPNHGLAPDTAALDSPEMAKTYLRHELGNHYDAPMIETYLTEAPKMLAFMARFPSVQFQAIAIPDYHPDSPGASKAPRALRPIPYDGRELGADFAHLEPPIPEMMLWRRLSIDSADASHGFYALKSGKSFAHMARLVLKGLWARRGQPRDPRLVNGNALAARLARAVMEQGIPIHLGQAMTQLVTEGGRVQGLRLASGQQIMARRGVILATGGLAHDRQRMAALLPAQGRQHLTVAGPGATGDGARAAEALGARVMTEMADAGAFVPLSLVPQRDGKATPFPHLVERAKPGFLIVNHEGERFTDESASYHDVVIAMNSLLAHEPEARFYVIGDHPAVRRYGIGAVPPAPIPMGRMLKSGYLTKGSTPAGLAKALGLPPKTLEATVAAYNADALQGKDRAYGRGSTAYTRFMGDARAKGHPNIGPLANGPFYAVRIYPGDLGAMIGLRTDPSARVLDAEGHVIQGLWAVGNDMASVVRGTYPGAGVTLGPAMTFGYLAGQDAARG